MTGTLDVYTIYDHPSDYPDKYVLRVHHAAAGQTRSEAVACLFDSLDAAREALPPGLVCVGREMGDDPVIVESWI